MLSPSLDTFRLFIHVVAASVWVGGQIAIAGVVGPVRAHDPSATRAVAYGFARVAWPAFALAVVTGIWSLLETDVANTSSKYQATLMIKILVVAFAGMFAAVHSMGKSKVALAVGGAAGLVASLLAMYLGVLLAGG